MQRLEIVAVVLAILWVPVGCDSEGEHAKRAERTLGRAQGALHKAGRGVRAGYDKAKGRVDSVDWVEAFEDTRDKANSAAEKMGIAPGADEPETPTGEPPWWRRGTEAAKCAADVCEIADWYVQAARRNPTRLTGDVKVLTALDDSGWLLDGVESGSVAHAMGFRRGDIVMSIAGRPLTDRWARIEILDVLRSQSQVEVRYRRAGAKAESTMTIRFLDPKPPASG